MTEGNKKGKKERPATKEDIYNAAIQHGLDYLAHQPGLEPYAMLIKNADNNKVNEFIQSMERKYGENGPTNKQQYKEMTKYLANYAAQGGFLKEKAKEIVLEEGIERNMVGKLRDFLNPNRVGGIEYFRKSQEAFEDLQAILSQSKVAQKQMPKLTEATHTLYMYGYLNAALKTLKAHGIMDDRLYKELSKLNFDTTTSRAQKGVKGLETYIRSEAKKEKQEEETAKEKESDLEHKVAASIIGLAGFLLIFFNLRVTGAVIGGDSFVTGGIIGIFLIFFALLLFFRPLKRKFKK